MKKKLLSEIFRCKGGRAVWIVSLVVFCCALLPVPFTALGADAYSLGGRIVMGIERNQMVTGPVGAQEPIMQTTEITLFAIPSGKIVGKTVPSGNLEFAFFNLEPGEYLIQVVAPNYIVSKTRVAVGALPEAATQQLEIKLRRPIDPGMGNGIRAVPSFSDLPSAGVNHAFGCISISLVFVQYQGSNTWTPTQINDSMTAAQTAMTSFQTIAPAGANITTHVENFGTYTVMNPVGNWCADADLWVDEILTQAGYTTGSLDARIATLSNDRRDLNCGTNPTCSACGVNSSSYLFFITRDDSTMWGGWNCGNRYLISYWNRYDEAVVYMHEVGHGFGANDEYCVPNQDYCCGWVTGSWGCTNIGGCLNQTNDNCDPACGSDCGGGGPFVDCQNGCPNANCTTHTLCAMDGSGTLSYCPTTRVQMGWVDTDGDGALDCLETACGTAPNNPASIPSCLNRPPVCDSNGPYTANCQGTTTTVNLDATGSSDPDGDAITYSWSTDCPGGSFDNSTSSTPTLTVNTSPGCYVNCNVDLTVTDSNGASSSCSSTVTIRDMQPPQITCPSNKTIECDASPNPTNTGSATATDTCDSNPVTTRSDNTTGGSCPQASVITRTWRAKDACTNSSSCNQTINVVDTVPPILVGVPGNLTAQCDAVPTPANVTATDNCDSTVVPSFNQTRVDGSCASNYTLTRTWSAADDCENMSSSSQTITVQDTVGPVITCNNPATMTPKMAPTSFTATASDNCSTPTVQITGYSCYSLKNGVKYKNQSCAVNIAGNTINIVNSGGVGDNIAWTVHATDSCANSSDKVCSIKVVNPNK